MTEMKRKQEKGVATDEHKQKLNSKKKKKQLKRQKDSKKLMSEEVHSSKKCEELKEDTQLKDKMKKTPKSKFDTEAVKEILENTNESVAEMTDNNVTQSDKVSKKVKKRRDKKKNKSNVMANDNVQQKISDSVEQSSNKNDNVNRKGNKQSVKVRELKKRSGTESEIEGPDSKKKKIISSEDLQLKDKMKTKPKIRFDKEVLKKMIDDASESSTKTTNINVVKSDKESRKRRRVESETKGPGSKKKKMNLSNEVISIANSDIGVVLGKGGSTLKQITEESHTKIHLSSEGEVRMCTITGTKNAIANAKSMIEELVNDRVSEELTLQKDQVGKIIGKRGKTINYIRSKAGAVIYIQGCDQEGADKVCHISGTEKSVRKARSMIEGLLTRKKQERKDETLEKADESMDEQRAVTDIRDDDDEDDDFNIPENDSNSDSDDDNIQVSVLVTSSTVQTLRQNGEFQELEAGSGVKITLDCEEDEPEGFCKISGEEKVVMETKNKLQNLIKKLQKKEEKKKKTRESAGLQVTGSLSWDAEFKLPKPDKDESSSDESDNEQVQKPVKKTKAERRKEKLAEEKQLYEYERKKLEGEIIPETADDFDRLVVNSPDSSVVWLRYMAFHLETSEFDKARSIAERALKTISFREEREKLNIWVAYLNLENMYGTNETIGKVLARAITQCEPLDVYLPLVNIYVESSKIEEAEQLYNVMAKKYSTNKVVWTKFADFYFQQNRPESARKLLQRALKSVENRDHVETITKFAQMEFKHGEPERGKTMFENVLTTYPRRTDIWSLYVDLLTKLHDHDVTRGVYKKMIGLQLAAKKIKFFFKKYLEFEERFGTEAQIDEVKQKALQYVESGGSID